MTIGRAVLFAACLIGASEATAQDRLLEELAKKAFPELGPSNAQVLVDVDVDGRLDVLAVTSSWPPGNFALRNIGQRTLEERRIPSAAMTCLAVAAGDVDGDGKPDFVTGNWRVATDTGQTRLFLGRGDWTFRDATAQVPVDSAHTGAVALGDVDGDGDLDLVIGNRYSPPQTALYVNDGKGTFTDVTAQRVPVDADDTRAVALGDVDGDGDLDLVLGNADANTPGQRQPNRVYVNDGKGSFSDGSSRALGILAEGTLALLLLDVDADQDLDLVEANDPGGGQSRVRINDGKGVFTGYDPLPPAPGRSPTAIAHGDIDGDGDPDLVLANGDREPDVFLNNGKGRFALGTAQWMLPSVGGATGASLLDVDRDGDLDLHLGRATEDRGTLYLNVEGTRFVDARGRLFTDSTKQAMVGGVALGDVDGNGTLDAVVANAGASPQDELLLGDGTGRFVAVPGGLPPDVDRSLAVLLADLDGDGDRDVVVGNDGTRSRLYVNDGGGRFTDRSVQLPSHLDATRALAAGDVDGDGDVDLVVGNKGQNRLYLNNGSGTFAWIAAMMPTDNDRTAALALVDVDGDQDLDLVLANGGLPNDSSMQQNKLYLNNRGWFQDVTSARFPAALDATSAVSAGDVDRDGDVDLYFANGGLQTGPEQDRLYLNDGSGTFVDATSTRLPVDIRETTNAALADIDADGDLDVLACEWGALLYGYGNDGTGRFTRNLLRPTVLPGRALVVADVDGDGDLDLMGGASLLSGLRRQVHSPTLAWLGGHYALDLYAEPNLTSTTVVLFLAHRATAGITVPPYGRLLLDPTALLSVEVFSVLGRRQVGFPIPNVPSLNGVRIYSQSLVLHGAPSATWRLSNLHEDRILR